MARSFFIKAHLKCPMGDETSARLPAHSLVIEPLIAASSEILVHQRRGHGFTVPVPPHKKIRHALMLDSSQEILRGWEPFWNSGCCSRGSISIKVINSLIDWEKIFEWTEYGGIWTSKNQILKGTPSGGVSYSMENAREGFSVASFSASNGIEWMDLWFDDQLAEAMDSLAQRTCRNFVRFIENGKFPREIVYDRPPYSSIT